LELIKIMLASAGVSVVLAAILNRVLNISPKDDTGGFSYSSLRGFLQQSNATAAAPPATTRSE
jgi:hypothetical protein